MEIKIKLRTKIIYSDRWTDISMCSRYAGTACITEFMRFLTSAHPEHFHTLAPSRAHICTYATAKGPAHARKGNEA